MSHGGVQGLYDLIQYSGALRHRQGGEHMDNQSQIEGSAKATIEMLLGAIDRAGRAIGPISGEGISEETRLRLSKANVELGTAYYEATGAFLEWWLQ